MEIKFCTFNDLITEFDIDINYCNHTYKYLGYYIDKKLCGYLIYLELDVVEVIYIFTKSELRRKLIATKLLSYIFNLNKEVFLEVNSYNIPAINLYYKQGFVLNRIRKNYYGQNLDAIEMKR